MTTRTVNANDPIQTPRLAHFVLRAGKFDEMVDFYMNVLGAHIVERNEQLAFLTYDDEHHRLALINMSAAADQEKGPVGLDHVAYTLADLGDLFRHYVRLKDQGLLPFWTINHGMTTSMYYRDPDGNGVEFQVDNFKTQAELEEFFASGKFKENPIGIDFDAEKLLAMYEDGVAISELLKQGTAAK